MLENCSLILSFMVVLFEILCSVWCWVQKVGIFGVCKVVNTYCTFNFIPLLSIRAGVLFICFEFMLWAMTKQMFTDGIKRKSPYNENERLYNILIGQRMMDVCIYVHICIYVSIYTYIKKNIIVHILKYIT